MVGISRGAVALSVTNPVRPAQEDLRMSASAAISLQEGINQGQVVQFVIHPARLVLGLVSMLVSAAK